MMKYYWWGWSLPLIGIWCVIISEVIEEGNAWGLALIYGTVIYGPAHLIFLFALSFFRYFRFLFRPFSIILETLFFVSINFLVSTWLDKNRWKIDKSLFRFILVQFIIFLLTLAVAAIIKTTWKYFHKKPHIPT